MFIGKSVCLVAFGAIVGVCLLCLRDGGMSKISKFAILGLTILLGLIVFSL